MDDAKIQALLHMAAMQSGASGTAQRRHQRSLIIFAAIMILLVAVLYGAVTWASHHYR